MESLQEALLKVWIGPLFAPLAQLALFSFLNPNPDISSLYFHRACDWQWLEEDKELWCQDALHCIGFRQGTKDGKELSSPLQGLRTLGRSLIFLFLLGTVIRFASYSLCCRMCQEINSLSFTCLGHLVSFTSHCQVRMFSVSPGLVGLIIHSPYAQMKFSQRVEGI